MKTNARPGVLPNNLGDAKPRGSSQRSAASAAERLRTSQNLTTAGAGPLAVATSPEGTRGLHPEKKSGCSVSRWQTEYSRILLRLCLAIAAKRVRGLTLRQALKQPAWYWRKPRYFRSDPSRRVRLSRGTILKWYFAWEKSGRSRDAFKLYYRSGRRKLAQEKLIQFVHICAGPEVFCYRIAACLAGCAEVTDSAFRHALPSRITKLLKELFRHRRRALYTSRKIRRALSKGIK